jgi:hypothetical protein
VGGWAHGREHDQSSQDRAIERDHRRSPPPGDPSVFSSWVKGRRQFLRDNGQCDLLLGCRRPAHRSRDAN